jgi:hypothetical protein
MVPTSVMEGLGLSESRPIGGDTNKYAWLVSGLPLGW